MAATFTKIATVTVGSGGASSIDFSSIDSSYTDLCLKISTRVTLPSGDVGAYNQLKVRFNADSGSNYLRLTLYGNGSGTASETTTTTYGWTGWTSTNNNTASTFGSTEVYIPNYNSSNQKSTCVDAVSENNATSALASLNAMKWSGTSAINQITIYPDVSGSTIAQYSTATLYGIKNS